MSGRGHMLMVPDEVWEWAQQESGLSVPGPWLRERLIEMRHRSDAPALFEVPTPPAPSTTEPRDWNHETAPRTVGKFIRRAKFPTSCVDCGLRIREGDPVYISTTRQGVTQERCWDHGERYKNYWWPTKRGPHMEES